MQQTRTHVLVGLFMVLAAIGAIILAVQVSGLSLKQGGAYYQVHGLFDNIGSLKVRQPVRIAGVTIGQVVAIELDQQRYVAKVIMSIDPKYQLPQDTQASIMTEGVLGSKYISITPGFDEAMLADGDAIEETHSALILEDAIGKFLFNAGSKED